MFTTTKIDLGFCKVGRPYLVKYPYKDIRSIDKMEGSCDCISFNAEKDMNRVVVEWKPKAIPVHLKEQGQTSYETQKQVTVHYTTTDKPDVPQVVILLFNAVVTE